MGFYVKLAVSGINKNRKMYLPYILAGIGMVMMFYILHFLHLDESVGNTFGGEIIQTIMGLGSFVIAIFSTIFLFYTNSFLIRRRKREFGLFNILGMGKRNIARILIWETFITAFIDIAVGLFCGILFSKLFELLVAKLLISDANFVFSISIPSIIFTTILFAVIFLLILLNSLRQLHMSKPVELLQSDTVGEKPPKANWIIAFLGAVVLGVAYYIAISIEEPISALLWFFVAVILVIIATYMLFVAGSVVLCKILQKNKKYYYKANHFISVSSMSYRMKRNGAGLASICILSTMVLVMISSTLCLLIGSEEMLRARYPRNFQLEINSEDQEVIDAYFKIVDDAIAAHSYKAQNIMRYRYLNFAGFLSKNHLSFYNSEGFMGFPSDLWELYIIPLDDYNTLSGNSEILGENEVLTFAPKVEYSYNDIIFDDNTSYTIKRKLDSFPQNGKEVAIVNSALYVVVPDMSYIHTIQEIQFAAYEDHASNILYYYGLDLNCESQEQIELYNEIYGTLEKFSVSNNIDYLNFESSAYNRNDIYSLYGGLFFLGAMLGLVFIFAAVLIMYYKQITEGYEDQSRFEILQKVGITKKEIRRSINSQVLTVFFAPLLMAGIHLAFSFPLIYKLLFLFGLTNQQLFIIVMICCFLLFTLLYTVIYRLTSHTYYNIVSGKQKLEAKRS